MNKWLSILLVMFVGGSIALGKRTPAPIVLPITHSGVIYSAEGEREGEVVVAREEKSGSELWRAEIYRQHIDPTKEADVQMIFIKGMLLSGEKLLIQDEAGRCYRLELGTQKVQGVNCKKYRSLKSTGLK